MNEAQLYYDDCEECWILSYRDDQGRGNYVVIDVESGEDASLEELANAVHEEVWWAADGTVEVCGEGAQAQGTITFLAGELVGWQAS